MHCMVFPAFLPTTLSFVRPSLNSHLTPTRPPSPTIATYMLGVPHSETHREISTPLNASPFDLENSLACAS